MILRAAAISVLLVSVGLVYATSRHVCSYGPRSHWLSVTEVELKLRDLGLKLRALRVTDERCYAVLADDKQGKMVNLIINPVTAMIMKETASP